MKHISLITLLAMTLTLASCHFGGGSTNDGGRMPASRSGFTDDEKEEIMDQNNPLRKGTTYFYSESMGYSVQYPNSFVDFKKDGDRGFTCKSKDGLATMKVWGEPCNMEVEDVVAKSLAQYNKSGAQVSDTNLDDDAFSIDGEKDGKGFYQRTIVYGGKCATLYFEYSTEESDNFDPEAVYSSIGPELGESLIAGAPPIEAKPKKVDPNAVAQVAYAGEWHTFSTMTDNEFKKKYPEFNDVNSWEAQTDGKEVYLILAAHEDDKITVKNTKTGERLYNRDSRPLIVRCNKDGQPDMEITIIGRDGKITRYVPKHDSNNHPITAPGVSDMTR